MHINVSIPFNLHEHIALSETVTMLLLAVNRIFNFSKLKRIFRQQIV